MILSPTYYTLRYSSRIINSFENAADRILQYDQVYSYNFSFLKKVHLSLVLYPSAWMFFFLLLITQLILYVGSKIYDFFLVHLVKRQLVFKLEEDKKAFEEICKIIEWLSENTKFPVFIILRKHFLDDDWVDCDRKVFLIFVSEADMLGYILHKNY